MKSQEIKKNLCKELIIVDGYSANGKALISGYLQTFTRIQKKVNKNNFIGILVEGKEGIDNLESISKVKGIDLIYLGLFDICQSVGLPGQLNNNKVVNKIIECQKIIESNKKIAGCMSVDIKYSKMLIKLGYKFIAYLNDAYALKKFYDNELELLKK